MAVYKIGSRWGNCGESVLDLFLNYECVFFGCCGARIGNWRAVKPGDFFLISDGAIPVAIGKSLGFFQDYKNAKISFTKKDYDAFIDENVRICPASIILLPSEERNESWGNDRRKTFCRHHEGDIESEERVKSMWEKISEEQHKSFKIIPRTTSLFSTDDAVFSEKFSYRIPKYQRPYSWGENELRRLIESIRDALQTDESVFMGTMQLSAPIPLSVDLSRIAYNIIDGQQRITTFFILVNLIEYLLHIPSKISEARKSSILQTWVSCGEEQMKLERYLMYLHDSENCGDILVENNRYLQNHFLLKNLLEEYFPQDDSNDSFSLQQIHTFLTSNKIIFVVIETHAGLSKTLKIFNTINTSGLSLGTEDIFKIRFYEYLRLQGEPESIFDQISEVYAKIEEYNREAGGHLWMENVLGSCQRIIIARENLNDSTFFLSYETFFERLFDTILGVRIWPEFKCLRDHKVLDIKDLNCIVDCYKEDFMMRDKDENYHYQIARRMIWETRYGFVWDFPIIARFFGTISKEHLLPFTWSLFKVLCPPSLFFAKAVYSVRSALIGLLKTFPRKDVVFSFPQTVCPNMNTCDMLDHAFEYQIAWYPKWKNLICRLVEYLKSPTKDKALYERLWSSTDIEHIQCFTDEKDCEGVRALWGDELNRLGNLVLLESSLNRSIKNYSGRKSDAYHKSRFFTICELADKVEKWTKVDAEKRRANNSKIMKDFLLTIDKE